MKSFTSQINVTLLLLNSVITWAEVGNYFRTCAVANAHMHTTRTHATHSADYLIHSCNVFRTSHVAQIIVNTVVT